MQNGSRGFALLPFKLLYLLQRVSNHIFGRNCSTMQSAKVRRMRPKMDALTNFARW